MPLLNQDYTFGEIFQAVHCTYCSQKSLEETGTADFSENYGLSSVADVEQPSFRNN
jgi:hypothetical protein